MIVIYTELDLNEECRSLPVYDVETSDIKPRLAYPATDLAQDVYFWKDGEVKPLKRRNHPLVVPEWLNDLEGVGR